MYKSSVFKNKTERNRNDEKYNQTGITVKIQTNHDGVWANMIMPVHRGSLIMGISVYHSKASLRNYIGRPSSEKIRACSNILSDALSEKSQLLQPRFAELSSRAIFMFRWIRLSFIQKTLTLNSLFSTLSCEKTRVFLRAIIRLNFTAHFTSRFCIRDFKYKSVTFHLPDYFTL